VRLRPLRVCTVRDKPRSLRLSRPEWDPRLRRAEPERLAIGGANNGGLLVGAAAVQCPGLFRAELCEAPLLDMVRYHKFGYASIRHLGLPQGSLNRLEGRSAF